MQTHTHTLAFLKGLDWWVFSVAGSVFLSEASGTVRLAAGEVFCLARLYLPFLSELALTSGYTPPAAKEQESGWREEGREGAGPS